MQAGITHAGSCRRQYIENPCRPNNGTIRDGVFRKDNHTSSHEGIVRQPTAELKMEFTGRLPKFAMNPCTSRSLRCPTTRVAHLCDRSG